MNSAIGEILPLALGRHQPRPDKARGTSVGFLVGWILGIVVTIIAFTLVSSLLPQDGDTSKPIAGVIKIILGALLLLLAAKQWRSRPHTDAEPPLPKWMAAIDSMTAARGFLLGFALSALNPKNLLMGIGAGVTIGSAGLTVGESTATIVIYTIISASTVAVPVIAYLVASRRMAGPLEKLRAWLVHNNATVMAVLLLVIGVVVIGKGIGSF
jgi:threonine/homoserine/homoserine lactone efflux protein